MDAEADAAGASDVDVDTDADRPSRVKVAAVVVPIVALIICSNVGDALTSTWADQHPLALIALNSRTRILVLASNQLDAVSYYVVATVRLLLSDPLFFLLGTWYGDGVLRWTERRSPTFGDLLRKLEAGLGKAGYLLVAVMPNQWICLLAGVAGMSVAGFFAANLAGTVVRLYLVRRLGEAFERPIDDILGFFADYRLPLFIFSVVLFGAFLVLELRRARTDLGALVDGEVEADPVDDRADDE